MAKSIDAAQKTAVVNPASLTFVGAPWNLANIFRILAGGGSASRTPIAAITLKRTPILAMLMQLCTFPQLSRHCCFKRRGILTQKTLAMYLLRRQGRC